MKTIHEAWREWHKDLSDDMVPVINPSFQRAWDARQEEVDAIKNEMEELKKYVQYTSYNMRHGVEEGDFPMSAEAECIVIDWADDLDKALVRKAASK